MRIAGSVALLCMLLLSGCNAENDDATNPIVIENAWLRTPPQGLDKTAGYFQLTNRTGDSMTLVGAISEQIRSIEIHTTIVDGDMMRMRRLSTIPIPPGETIRFEPGGMHLMIFGLRTSGDITITLQFEDGTAQTVPFVWKDS